eukprot:6694324-Prymnesium_polylepis.1
MGGNGRVRTMIDNVRNVQQVAYAPRAACACGERGVRLRRGAWSIVRLWHVGGGCSSCSPRDAP